MSDVTNSRWMKRSIQYVRQTNGFECNRNRNFNDRNLCFTWQLRFKKQPFVKFWCSIKRQCPKLF